jgi:uncharacterized protein YabE (DUF348 family)
MSVPGEYYVRITVLKLPKSRAVRLGAQAAVLTALVAGTAAYAANDTTVQLTVDGKEQDVRVFGRTVDDVLKAADVDVNKRDVVAPALGERISEGSDVVVRHARLLTVTVDGETQQHWTTALTVDEALDDLNVRADGARLSASRSTPLGRKGLNLEVVTPKDVTIVADGKNRPVTSTAPTVGALLEENGLKKATADRVSAPLANPLTDGLVIKLVRVTSKQVTETQAIPFETKKVESNDLFKGDTKVQEDGVAGVRTITYTVTLADGVEEKRVKSGEQVTKQPVAKVVEVGTKERPAPKTSSSSSAPRVASGSDWDRLAQCESGGNWQINSGNGYYGGLQFSASSWRAVGGSGLPHQHSREVQIQMGERLKAEQGWGAWPACSAKLGLR